MALLTAIVTPSLGELKWRQFRSHPVNSVVPAVPRVGLIDQERRSIRRRLARSVIDVPSAGHTITITIECEEKSHIMSQGITTVIYPVRDLAAAKARFSRLLGMEPTSDAPYYVGFRINGQDIGLNPHGHAQGMTGPVAYCEVADIKASLDALLADGAESVDDPRDVGGGKLIATVRDPEGNVIGLMQTP